MDSLPAPLFVRLVDAAQSPVIVIDGDGMIRYLNEAMHALAGYAPGEALGQPLTGLLPENLAPAHQDFVSDFIQGTRASTVLGQVRAFAIRHRGGAMIPIELKAIDLGVHDGQRYFGAYMEDLRPRRQREEELTAMLDKLERQALRDTLTGLPNRRAFNVEAARTVSRAQRSDSPLTVGIADIDFFKKVNDRYGHPSGDVVLKTVAQILTQAARNTDFVARVGGEEFGLLFPAAAPAKASLVAERIREAVARTTISALDGTQLNVTVSIGLAGMAPGDAFEDAMQRADRALYQAKNGGRNRVEQA